MFLGGYERWMLRFWMLRKLNVTLLDASILTRSSTEIYSRLVQILTHFVAVGNPAHHCKQR